jgi:tetratricopeptide (TPR) repeat protein
MIFEAIRETVGFLEMNKRVISQIREWLLATAISAAEDVQSASNGQDDETLARMHHQVGYVLFEFGDIENALKHFQQSLAIYLKTLGESHPDTATSYNNIGGVYFSVGDYDRAIEFYQQSLAI